MNRIIVLVLVLLFVGGSVCMATPQWDYLVTNSLGDFYLDSTSTVRCSESDTQYLKVRLKVIPSASIKYINNLTEDEYTINTYVINKKSGKCYLQAIERYTRGDRLTSSATFPEKWHTPGYYNVKEAVKKILEH